MNNVGTAYVLWLGCLLQLHGLQRLYNGKIFTGLLWLCTFGLFGFGQLLDLVLIPKMVEDYNTRKSRQAMLPGQTMIEPTAVQRVLDRTELPTLTQPNLQVSTPQLGIQLAKAAARRGGQLSVTQGVLETDSSFDEVELALKTLVRSGYVDVTNDPETGVVLYEFREL